jgi:hypothetical protein
LFVCSASAEFQAYSQNNISAYFPEIEVLASNKPAEGYFFFGSKGLTAPNAVQYIAIIDNYGTPVFFRKMDKLTSSMRVLPDGRIAYMHGAPRRLYFLNEELIVTDSVEVQGYQPDGHDWAQAENGHLLLLGKHKWDYDMSQIAEGGQTDAEIIDLIVQEFDENYNLLYTWNSADHFEITDGNENSPYLDFTESQIDYVHANAISVDSDTSFLVSLRHMDEITKVDRRSGEIIWRLGGKKNQFQFVNDDLRFSHQHGIRKLDNGNILLFDNGNLHPTQVSGAVEYQLDEINKTATLIKRYYRDSMVYSNHAGAVQGLHNGNILTCWGPYWPSFTEFYPDGSVALEWDFTKHSFSPRIEKYIWKTKVFETSTDTIEFNEWEGDTLKTEFWITNNVSNEIQITTVDKHTPFFGISEDLPIAITPGDSVKVHGWFYPDENESGYYTDVLTLAYDTDNERIARQIKVTGWKEDNIAPEAQMVTESTGIVPGTKLKIGFNEAVRTSTEIEFDHNLIDDYIILKKNNENGADVLFNATISSDNKLVTINPENLEIETTYYLSFKSGIVDFNGNGLIPFSVTFSTVTTNTDLNDMDKKISVYPNPVQSMLSIHLNNLGKNGQLKIYTQTGQLLITKEIHARSYLEIDFSKFRRGVYFIDYQDNENRISKKILKY